MDEPRLTGARWTALAVSGLLYVVACASPIYVHGDGRVDGWQALVAGPLTLVGCAQPMWVLVPWLANFLVAVGTADSLRSPPGAMRGRVVRLVGVACALVALLTPGRIVLVADTAERMETAGFGLYVWVASLVVLALAGELGPRTAAPAET